MKFNTYDISPGSDGRRPVKVRHPSRVLITLLPADPDAEDPPEPQIWVSVMGLAQPEFSKAHSVFVDRCQCPYEIKNFKGTLFLLNPGSYTATVAVSVMLEEVA